MASAASASAERAAPFARSWQHQFVCAERGKMPFNAGISNVGERARLPARRVVLVDDYRPDPLADIVPVHDTRDDAEFAQHAVLERPVLAAPHLRERDLQRSE